MLTESPLTALHFLGFDAHPGSCDDYLTHVQHSVDNQQNTTVLAHNLHSLYLYYRSSSLRKCYENKVNMVDGMPIIWLLQLAGKKIAGNKIDRTKRLTYVDFIWPLLQQAQQNNWRVCHVGQSSAVQQQALANIKAKFPDLQLLGIPGYFDHTANSAGSLSVVEEINDFSPQLLLVGLGSPLQEHWIFHHRQQLQVPAVLSCGACMEYVAGNVGTPPRWMGRTGLEWSYRLLENPRRFASRYLLEPWALLFSMLRYRLSGHH